MRIVIPKKGYKTQAVDFEDLEFKGSFYDTSIKDLEAASEEANDAWN